MHHFKAKVLSVLCIFQNCLNPFPFPIHPVTPFGLSATFILLHSSFNSTNRYRVRILLYHTHRESARPSSPEHELLAALSLIHVRCMMTARSARSKSRETLTLHRQQRKRTGLRDEHRDFCFQLLALPFRVQINPFL